MNEDILILGAGESGVGAAKLALSLGYTPFVSDAGSGKSAFLAELDADGIEYEVGGHNPSIWPMVKTVVKSPGIPEDSSVVEELRSAVNSLARITGHVDVEDLLDIIFKDFCIGK